MRVGRVATPHDARRLNLLAAEELRLAAVVLRGKGKSGNVQHDCLLFVSDTATRSLRLRASVGGRVPVVGGVREGGHVDAGRSAGNAHMKKRGKGRDLRGTADLSR